METTDVLIVGAGPTGLALACALALRGVDFRIVDRHPHGANTSRAAVIHAGTLEALEPIGVVPELLARGIEVPIFRTRDRDHALMTVDFRGLPSRYAYTLMCPQNETEDVLLQRLEALGHAVLRPWAVTTLSEGADGVTVELASGDARRALCARYVVGCDGMHSVVREQAGIGFDGGQYAQSFVLADVRMHWPLPREEVSLFFSPAGLVVVAPLPHGRFRIVATADDPPADPGLDFFQALLDARGPRGDGGRIEEILWSSRFRVHHRVAQTLHKGRVLLVGDAAHVHSPAGGQGMNTGIQDAISLGAALAERLSGAGESRLARWAERRREVARSVVRFTHRMTRVATLRGAVAKLARNALLWLIGRIPPARRALAMNLSELALRGVG
jgi:2-polyprenyl-6-methoxyphenol hydroxylase-like FAD-dependent oxidoreductase